MRKIISREDRDKKNKRNQIIVGIFLIGIMIFGTLGYAFSGNSEDKKEVLRYKGIDFIKDDSEYWRFNIQGVDFITKYNPEEVEDVDADMSLFINDYKNKPLYFISEFQEPIFELGGNLNQFVLRINEACLDEENCLGNLPIKNCSIDNVVVFEEVLNESGKIYQEDNCIFISADWNEQVRYSDAFLFEILGV